MSEPTTANASLWDTFEHTPSMRQRVFMRYLTATLLNLVVLGLFAEYWEHVSASSFTVLVIAAVILQILLKLTIVVEHKVAAFFNARPGGFNKFMRFFGAWVVLFGSKFVILGALVLAFGDRLRFGGPFDGIVALIVVVVTMLVVEAVLVKFYRRLG
ncbi:MAG: hypothetical protein IAG10_21210 [Planctomycetaceae bacterium]|nr:hypothetical protein [Planctomycetaceae bacterium]